MMIYRLNVSDPDERQNALATHGPELTGDINQPH